MKRKIFKYLILVTLFGLVGCQTAQNTTTTSTTTSTSSTTTTTVTQTYTITVEANSYTDEGSPSNCNYAEGDMYAGYASGARMYGYFKFNLSSISTTETVSSAYITFNVTNVLGQDVVLWFYKLLSSWEAETLCWNNQPSPWGGTVGTLDLACSYVGLISVEVTDCVQNWVGGNIPNYGFMCKYPLDTTEVKLVQYYSNALGTALAPKLEITTFN